MPLTQVPLASTDEGGWDDYDPVTNTFRDKRTGGRVRPDGTAVEPEAVYGEPEPVGSVAEMPESRAARERRILERGDTLGEPELGRYQYTGPDFTKIPIVGQLARLAGAPETGMEYEPGFQPPFAFTPSRSQQAAAQELTGAQPGMSGQQLAGLALELAGGAHPALDVARVIGPIASPIVRRLAGRAAERTAQTAREAAEAAGPGLRRLVTEERGGIEPWQQTKASFEQWPVGSQAWRFPDGHIETVPGKSSVEHQQLMERSGAVRAPLPPYPVITRVRIREQLPDISNLSFPPHSKALYHVTPQGSLSAIQQQGLRPEGTDLSRLKPTERGYLFAASELPEGIIGDAIFRESGTDVRDIALLRFPRSGRWFRDPDVDPGVRWSLRSRQSIAPDKIELFTTEGWRPLKDIDTTTEEITRHRISVFTALSEGKPVRPDVLADYLDITKTPQPKPDVIPSAPGEAAAQSTADVMPQPWQMTRAEWYEAKNNSVLRPGTTGEGKRAGSERGHSRARMAELERLQYGVPPEVHQGGKVDHKMVIQKALAEGQPVPRIVLADYPDLTPLSAQGARSTADLTPAVDLPPPPPPPRPPALASGSSGPPPAGSPLDRLHTMWDEGARRPTAWERLLDAWANLPDNYRAFQEAWTDRYAGLNALNPKVEKVIARLGGIGEMQTQRSIDIAKSVKTALGQLWKDVDKHLDDYLHLKHVIDIEAIKGPQRKIPGGIKGAAEAQQGLRDLQSLLGPQRWQQLENGANAALAESKRTLHDLVAEGRVSPDLAAMLEREYPHYNQINIIRKIDELISRPTIGRRKISTPENILKRLTEEGTEAFRTSPYASIIGSAVDAEALIARNRAGREAATELIKQGLGKRIAGTKVVAQVEGEAIYRRPSGEIKDTISFWENGERVVVQVPEWAAKEAQAIEQAGEGGIVRTIGRLNQLPRAAFVTYNPAWPAANLAIDYFTAALQHGITPLDEARGLLEAIKDLSGNSPVLAQMRRSGGGQAGWFAPDAAKVAQIVRESGNLAITDEHAWRKFLTPQNIATMPFQFVKTVGQVAEQGTRAAVFSKVVTRTGSLDEGALAARRTTIDFPRGGNYAKAVNAVSIFFNAGLQGTLLPFRALRDNPRTRWSLGAAMGINMAVYAYNRQFPEYEDVRADVKRGSLILMLPSAEYDTQGRLNPHYVSIIPKVREWGLFFGTQTYILEELDKKQHEGLGRFLATQLSQSTPLDTGLVTGFTTVPGEVAIEQMTGYDLYRQRPMIPSELQGLPPTEQYTPYTSATIKGVAQMLGLSPIRLQEGFYGLTGGAGRTVTTITDALLQTINPSEVDFRIAELAHELDEIKAPDVPPDEVALRRIEFLNGLNAQDRQAVLELNRQPQEQIPIISAMLARFYGERGGELYRLGQERAQEATGKAPEQTRQASKALSGLQDILRQEQEEQDAVLEATPAMAKAWREAHADKAVKYQGALQGLGVVFPGAAQLDDRATWTEYQSAVYTLAGSEPDRRTRGQILAAGYRAIPLDNIDPLTKDFEAFRQRREEYKVALSDDDGSLLERTLDATRTKKEQEYAKDQETLKPYWEVGERVLQKYPAWQPGVARAKNAEAMLTDTQLKAWLMRNPGVKMTYDRYKKSVRDEREAMRNRHKFIPALLDKWGY